MTTTITINSDLGEDIGIHSFGNDEAILKIVDTVNVACGMHAGDPSTMDRTVRAAGAAGVTVGAHPGLPDITGFGCRRMAITTDEARDLVRYQVGALVGFLAAHGTPLDHIKPHGALFGMAASDEKLMRSICEVAGQYGVPVYGLAGTAHESAAASCGVEFVAELYVDLDYSKDGSLIAERRPKERTLESVRARTMQALLEGTVATVEGTRAGHRSVHLRALRPGSSTGSRKDSPGSHRGCSRSQAEGLERGSRPRGVGGRAHPGASNGGPPLMSGF